MTTRPVVPIIAVSALICLVATIGFAWLYFSAEDEPVARVEAPPQPIAPDPHVGNSLPQVSELPDQVHPITDERPREPTLAPKQDKELGDRNSKDLALRMLPRPRPKVWQVPREESALSYGESPLVWCPEESISSLGRCMRPLDDMLAGKAEGKLASGEFVVSSIGVLHLPTGTQFFAYLPSFRFGMIVDGQYSEKYQREQVRETIKNIWRQNIDSLDPNSGVSPP